MAFNHVAIVGAGPVGSMLAVLFRLNGYEVTLYEKRDEPTRAINIHTDKGLFEKAQALNPSADPIFNDLIERVKSNHGAILIKDLEELLRAKAKELGVNYQQQEILSFDELKDMHDENTLLLDCAGRKSPLRIRQFGELADDGNDANDKTLDIDHVIYLKITDTSGKKIKPSLYSSIKEVRGIKLAKIIKSKQSEDGSTLITLAMTVKGSLANKLPEGVGTSKNPYLPFASDINVDPEIDRAISAALAPLFLAGAKLDLNTLAATRVDTQTGYAKNRSEGNRVCMGDFAAFLVYFRSLNIGMEHAFKLVRTVNDYRADESEKTWADYLDGFEAKRQSSISDEVLKNQFKHEKYNLLARAIAVNGASPIKATETAQWLFFNNAIYPKNFGLFNQQFVIAKQYTINPFNSLVLTLKQLAQALLSSYAKEWSLSPKRGVKAASLKVYIRFLNSIQHLSDDDAKPRLLEFESNHQRIIKRNCASGVQFKYLITLSRHLLSVDRTVPHLEFEASSEAGHRATGTNHGR